MFVLFFLLHCNRCLQIHAASLEVVSSLSSFERLIDGSEAVHDVHKTLTELSRSRNKTEQNADNAPEIKQKMRCSGRQKAPANLGRVYHLGHPTPSAGRSSAALCSPGPGAPSIIWGTASGAKQGRGVGP